MSRSAPAGPRSVDRRTALRTLGLGGAGLAAFPIVGLRAGTAAALPLPAPVVAPERTAISLRTPWGTVGTPNSGQSRPGLSAVKLYMCDWVLNFGSRSAADLADCERMIRLSDDACADAIWAEYGPRTLTDIVAAHNLTATRPGATWGSSWTSADDLTTFLADLRRMDPGSRVLEWMTQALPVAADGTVQDWGTRHLSDVAGTKWGWSDFGPSTVASASFGPGFVIAALTYGTADDQTSDVLGAVRDIPLGALGPVAQSWPETTIDALAPAFGSLVAALTR